MHITNFQKYPRVGSGIFFVGWKGRVCQILGRIEDLLYLAGLAKSILLKKYDYVK